MAKKPTRIAELSKVTGYKMYKRNYFHTLAMNNHKLKKNYIFNSN